MRSRAARERGRRGKGRFAGRDCAGEGTAGKGRFAERDCAGEGTDNRACRNKNPLYNAGCEVIFFYIIVSKNCRL